MTIDRQITTISVDAVRRILKSRNCRWVQVYVKLNRDVESWCDTTKPKALQFLSHMRAADLIEARFENETLYLG